MKKKLEKSHERANLGSKKTEIDRNIKEFGINNLKK